MNSWEFIYYTFFYEIAWQLMRDMGITQIKNTIATGSGDCKNNGTRIKTPFNRAIRHLFWHHASKAELFYKSASK